MAIKEEYKIPVATKLKPEQFDLLKQTCDFGNMKQSVFIREAILSRLNDGSPSNLAGNNIVQYDSKKDNFIWKIKLDIGKEKTILENVSNEFLEDLLKELIKARHDRAILTKRNGNKSDSVTVPGGLVK